MIEVAGATAVAGILAFAAISKARILTVFAEQIADYGFVPYRLTLPAAGAITILESVSAGLLLVPDTREVGAGIAALLLALFSVVLLVTKRRGREVSCACFGGSAELDTVGWHSLARTLGLLVLAIAAMSGTNSALTAGSLAASVLLTILVFLLAELVRLSTDIWPRGRLMIADRPTLRAEAQGGSE
jgi:Methylamine utilisation protein MauE